MAGAPRLRLGYPPSLVSSALACGWRSPLTSLRKITQSQSRSSGRHEQKEIQMQCVKHRVGGEHDARKFSEQRRGRKCEAQRLGHPPQLRYWGRRRSRRRTRAAGDAPNAAPHTCSRSTPKDASIKPQKLRRAYYDFNSTPRSKHAGDMPF